MATPRKGALISDLTSQARSLMTRFRTAASGAVAPTPGTSGMQSQDATPMAPPPASTATPAATQVFDPPGGYFQSGRPLAPNAPPGSTTGRRWDFPSFINLNYNPRGEQGENAIDFPTLRMMADPAQGGLDTLRLAIETRKDQMAAQHWQIRGRDKDDDGGNDARVFEQWMRRPDGVHTFHQWMRMMLEDHFVIDAPAIYFSTLRGRPLFEPVDGATLKLLITAVDGRTPLPPFPAYQQVIKGIPAQNYTLEEMGYYPYNLRSSHIYGFSRVEQVVATVAIAINRAMSQLAYFTEGTVPDGFMELPKTWSLEEITRFTDWFNSEMSGQIGEKRKMRFVPEGAKYVPTKDAILKDVFDEWLVRVICYCFSLSPQAFVKEMNRATSETAKESALEEGLEPVKLWFKDVMDDILERSGFPELEWQWADEEIVDPQVKSIVVVNYSGGSSGTGPKIITIAEAREMAGFKPATPEQMKELMPPEPVVDPNVAPNGDGKTPPSPNGNGNGKKPVANGNGQNGNGKSSEKIVDATPRTFGYDRIDGARRHLDSVGANLTNRLDRVSDKVSGIDGIREQLASLRSTVDKIAMMPKAETPAPSIIVNAPPPPSIENHVHLPAPTRRSSKMVGKKQNDGSIEFTDATDDTNGADDHGKQ